MVNALILLATFGVIVTLDMKDDTVKNKCKNSKSYSSKVQTLIVCLLVIIVLIKAVILAFVSDVFLVSIVNVILVMKENYVKLK